MIKIKELTNGMRRDLDELLDFEDNIGGYSFLEDTSDFHVVKFNFDDMAISFNSRYLIDITSQIENDSIVINLKDPGSPVLIKDLSDLNSFHVVMPMKI